MTGLPPEVRETLDGHPLTAGFNALEASPEVETELDEFPRPRQHDLAIEGATSRNRLLVTVEAKVDEPFDRLIGPKMISARKNPFSNQPERIGRLAEALFGSTEIEPLAGLRYQLLAATAGTIIEAALRDINLSVLLVHVLITDLADMTKVDENALDLNLFISALAEKEIVVGANEVRGPFMVPGGVGGIRQNAKVMIGKAVADLR